MARPVFSHAKWAALWLDLSRRRFLMECHAETRGMNAVEWKRYTRLKVLEQECERRKRVAWEFKRNGWEYDKGWMLDREFVYHRPYQWQYEGARAWTAVSNWLYTRLQAFIEAPGRPDPRDEDAWFEWGRHVGRLRQAIQACDYKAKYYTDPNPYLD
jgi:hypothetical protein